MNNNGYGIDDDFQNIMKRKVVCDIAKLILKGIEQKNPHLSLALADTVPLIYSNSDEQLLNLTRLN